MASFNSRLQALEDAFNQEDPPWLGPPVMVSAHGVTDGEGYRVIADSDEMVREANAAGRRVILVVTHDDPDLQSRRDKKVS